MKATTGCCLALVMLLAACGGGDKNSAPSASGITIATSEDLAATGSITASDADDDALTAAISAAPTKGTASVTGANPFSVAYTPNANVNGPDSFTVVVTDEHGATATATVSVTITPVPDDPVMASQAFAVAEDATVGGQIVASDPDGDSLTFSATTSPAHGTLNLSASGGFEYSPAVDYHGADTFAVQVSDGARTLTATMNLTVTPVNDPVVVQGEYAVLASTSGLINVLANDSDVDGDPLTVTIESQPPGASAVIEANQIRLTGPQTFGGPTSLTYRVSDGAGSSAVATLGLLFQNPRLFFYATGAPNSSQRRIRYSNYFVNIELDTPIPAGETFDRFTTSLNGQWVLYVTRSNGPPVRHRLWLRSVGVPTDPVVEIPTFDPSFFVRHLALSPDGTLVAFNGRVAATANPAAHVPIDSVGIDIERPTFSNDSRSLFYSVLFNGGGRVIKRASIDSSANIAQRTQITADYPTAQGLGIDYRLTPQDDQVVSLGLIMPAGGGPGASIQQHAFVTPNDGSMADARLHPLPTPPIEGVGFLPVVSPDGRYAIYPATLNGGVSGLYSTDLQSPGTAILLAANAPSPGAHVFAGARTVLYPMPAAQPQGQNWFKAAVDVAASGVPFAPASGAPAPRIVAPALDGSAVVLDGGSQVYAAFGEQFDTATSLLTLANGDTVALLKYGTDSNAVFVVGASGTATILNPEAPGWSAALAPLPDYSAGIAAACIVSAGEGC